jgi:hypothetical protein
MAIPSFFKQNKPRGFNYKPRYYDPVKEELEQRRKTWEKEKRDSGERQNNSEPSPAEAAEGTSRQPYRSRIMRGDMKNYFNHRQEKVQKQTTIRLIVIIIILAFVVYLYLRF